MNPKQSSECQTITGMNPTRTSTSLVSKQLVLVSTIQSNTHKPLSSWSPNLIAALGGCRAVNFTANQYQKNKFQNIEHIIRQLKFNTWDGIQTSPNHLHQVSANSILSKIPRPYSLYIILELLIFSQARDQFRTLLKLTNYWIHAKFLSTK